MAEGAPGAFGGAWRQDAERWLNGAVPAGLAGRLRSRWRSSLWKWRNDATPRGRGQKAPSTRRCIKTISVIAFPSLSGVRKHPAPEGALRLNLVTRHDDPLSGQKAPSTRRCIKTHQASRCRSHPESQKAPSTRRCIKTIVMTISIRMMPPPESTSHQKMH